VTSQLEEDAVVSSMAQSLRHCEDLVSVRVIPMAEQERRARRRRFQEPDIESAAISSGED